MGRVCKRILTFTIQIEEDVKNLEYAQQKPIEVSTPSLFDYFPHVSAAKNNRRPIEPYMFLNMQENETRAAIDSAYRSLIEEWTKKQLSGTSYEKAVSHDVIRFINAAYKSLTDEPGARSQFNRIVQEELKDPTSYIV